MKATTSLVAPSKTGGKFWMATLKQFTVFVAWGSISAPIGGAKKFVFTNSDDALRFIAKRAAGKVAKGYRFSREFAMPVAA